MACGPALQLHCGAAQLAAAHCPNERALDPAFCSTTDPLMPHPAGTMAFPPRNVFRQRLTIFSSEYYQVLINCYSVTYPGGMQG